MSDLGLLMRKSGDNLFLCGMADAEEAGDEEELRQLLTNAVQIHLTVVTMLSAEEFIGRFVALRDRSDVVEEQVRRIGRQEICPVGALLTALEKICCSREPSEN
jgi:hypothetical protein